MTIYGCVIIVVTAQPYARVERNPAMYWLRFALMQSRNMRHQKHWARAVNDPKKLPILLAIPVLLFFVVGFLTGLLDLNTRRRRDCSFEVFFNMAG